jgi:hypothetical protein
MRRKTYLLWKKRLTQGAVVALLAAAFFVYFRTGFFTLDTYTISGAPDMYTEELERDIRLLAEDKILGILPGNRSVSYHDDDIRVLIKETLPNSKDISIYPNNLHTLAVKIVPYEALFSVSETHAISSDGTIYQEIIPIDHLPRITLATSSAVAPVTLVALSKLIQNVDAVLFPVRYVSVDEYNDIRIYDASKKTSIVISSTADMVKVWSNILSAIDTDPLKRKLAEKKETLEYIDTRFGNKVFYKFTNASAPAIIPPHESTTATTTILQ